MAVLLSALGNGVAFVVFPWLVLQRTGSAAAAGVVAAATAVPAIVTSLFAGTVIDVVGVRWTSIVSDLVSLVAVAAVPLLDQSVGLSLWALVALAALGALIDPAGVTAREVALPRLATVAHVSLDRANAVHEAVWGLALLIGPGVGGLLLATIGPDSRPVGHRRRIRGLDPVLRCAAGPRTWPTACVTASGTCLARHRGRHPFRALTAVASPCCRLGRRCSSGYTCPSRPCCCRCSSRRATSRSCLGIALAAIAAGGVAGSLLYAAVGKHPVAGPRACGGARSRRGGAVLPWRHCRRFPCSSSPASRSA